MRDIFGETIFNFCSALEFKAKTPDNIATTVKSSKLIFLVYIFVKGKGDDQGWTKAFWWRVKIRFQKIGWQLLKSN